MNAVAFTKYEGLGNDFLVIDADAETLSVAEVVRLCDRRFGVGGDGVLFVLPSRVAGCVARMKVVNADGSVPEMCGNGLRCVVLHLAGKRGLDVGMEIAVDTDAGVRRSALAAVQPPDRADVVVEMGVVRVNESVTLEAGGLLWELALADAGNPHAVTFQPHSRLERERSGLALATHARFPAGVNVGFARIVEDQRIELVVWERGVGITMACGTGACAAVACAAHANLVSYDRPVRVDLPGGMLEVTVARDGHARMRGPARRVFSGNVIA